MGTGRPGSDMANGTSQRRKENMRPQRFNTTKPQQLLLGNWDRWVAATLPFTLYEL